MGCSGSNTLKNDKTKSTNTTSRGNVKIKSQSEKGLKFDNSNLVGHNRNDINYSYKFIEKLGEGTFGKVYKAMHHFSNQYRAVKKVNKKFTQYQDGETNFLIEIDILAKLDHPNIIKVYEYFTDKRFYYIVTELATGGELYEQIYKIHSFCERDAANIMKQLFSAVCYLHAQGIVHRDIKPENLLLETSDNNQFFIKVIDFGTSKLFNQEDAKNKKLTLKVGTPYYIAPEVLDKEYDNKCDLWSCGVILYILLSGYPPFDGENDKEIMDAVRKGEFSFNEDAWNHISKDAKSLISKLLTKNPNKRLSAEGALKDPWIMKHREKWEGEELIKLSSENLRKFTSKQKFQQASIAFIIHQMSANDMVKKLRDVFKKMDLSGDGRLSLDELKDGYVNNFSDQMTEEEFDSLIKSIDQDGSGYLEYEEFLRATVSTELIFTEKNMKMAFSFFDKDGSGMLSRDEIKEVLASSDESSAEAIDKIVQEMDTNGDGMISYKEFTELMKKSI